MTVAFRGGRFAKGHHQLRAIDAAAKRKTVLACNPNEWHGIGNNQVGGVQNSPEDGIVRRLGYAVHSRERDVVAAAAAANPEFHSFNHLGDLDGIDANVQDAKRVGGKKTSIVDVACT
jgi:hypothetical protein